MPIGSPNAGYRLFNTGDVLTAAQVQFNLQNQTIMYFADAAARDAALTVGVVQEGMFAYLADTNATVFYDGSAWLSVGDVSNVTLTSPKETIEINGLAATGTMNLNLLTSGVWSYTANATGNFVVNLRGDGTTTLNTMLASNEQISVVFNVTNGSPAYYLTSLQIDGVAQTVKWLGGTAPSAGNINSVDAYVFTVQKTGASTYTVFASQNKFA